MAKFSEAIAIEGSDGVYSANLDPEWTVSGNPHGGYLMALLANAALAADDMGEHPHALTASAVYLTPPVLGPATLQTEPLRRGRTASQWRVRLIQADQARVEALFTLGRLTSQGMPAWIDAPPPAVTALEACPVSPISPPGSGVRVEMLELVEQRLDPDSYRNGSGEFRGWLRFADGTPFDPLSLLYAADSFPPATFTLGSFGWVPTLEMTVYLRAVPVPGPLRIRQRARLLDPPVVDQICEIWDADDRLVAQATQLALVRMSPS